MKHLRLTSAHYTHLEADYAHWLDLLGYAPRTIYHSPLEIRELLHYLERRGLHPISAITATHIKDFITYLQRRKNLKYSAALSASTINGYITSLNLFARYLSRTGQHQLEFNLKRLLVDSDQRTILSADELQALYRATFAPHSRHNSLAMGQRDRAIIAIFYGCGLRKAEGAMLDLQDIDLIKRTVFVKKGKGNKQRYVPIAPRHSEDIRSYLQEGRYWFLADNRSAWHIKTGKHKEHTDKEAFFLNGQGRRMQSFEYRLKYMKQRAGIQKPFSTHSLRHSIATHLLQSGMPIEEIAKFLGHSSLESTQIYTAIVQELTQKDVQHDEQ